MRIVAAVEVFEAEVDFLFLGVGDDFLPAFDAVFGALLSGDPRFAHAGESDDGWGTEFDGEIDSFAEFLDDEFVIGWVERSSREAVAADEGNFQAKGFDE